jgi:hypothetical protein
MRPSLRKSPSSHKQRETLNWNAAPNMLARHRAQNSHAYASYSTSARSGLPKFADHPADHLEDCPYSLRQHAVRRDKRRVVLIAVTMARLDAVLGTVEF